MSIWASSSPQGHLLGHLGGSDLDFINFVCVLGPSWESLWGPFGYKFVILHVEIDVGIEKLFSKRFGKKILHSLGVWMC